MKIHNKLVRDKIPQIIEKDGKTCKTKILSNDEYKQNLNLKLHEEFKEYQESNDIEELADMVEVIHAILKVNNVSLEEFEKIRLNKRNKNGGFYDKIFLEEVSD